MAHKCPWNFQTPPWIYTLLIHNMNTFELKVCQRRTESNSSAKCKLLFYFSTFDTKFLQKRKTSGSSCFEFKDFEYNSKQTEREVLMFSETCKTCKTPLFKMIQNFKRTKNPENKLHKMQKNKKTCKCHFKKICEHLFHVVAVVVNQIIELILQLFNE